MQAVLLSTTHVQRKFEAIGARVKFGVMARVFRRRGWRGVPARNHAPFTVDVAKDRRGEFFDIQVAEEGTVDFAVLDAQRQDRHLLLMVKAQAAVPGRPNVQKFLCGHDERFWFVAGVSAAGVSTVSAAKDALKPAIVRGAEIQSHVKAKDRHSRRNSVFVRQGEWFFIPVPDLSVDERLMLRHEPLRRGAGKPHVAECLMRRGGTRVHVCNHHPNGLTDEEYGNLMAREPNKSALPWRVMVRDPEAYVKGRIVHPDHRTVCLPFWHRVLPNAEVLSRNVAFLD